MRQLVLLVAMGVLLEAARRFVPVGQEQPAVYGTALAFGFVMLAALLAGRLSAMALMPRLTGYLLVGLVCGPYALGLLSPGMVEALGLVDGAAICLIALTAGGELNVRQLRPLLASVQAITVYAVLGTAVLLSIGTFALRPLLPFLQELTALQAVAVSALIGITLVSQSPAVVMALLDETQSDGALSRTTLALVVISDLIIVALYALASALTNLTLGGGADASDAISSIAWEIFGSIGAGLVVGGLLAAVLTMTVQGRALLVLLLCIVVAEVCRRAHLEPMIAMISAGVLLANFTRVDCASLVHDIEASSLPVYLVFFAVAGAIFRLDLLDQVWVPAVSLVCLRAFGFFLGGRLAARRAVLPEPVVRYAWIGLLPQAGLALALAVLIKRSYPGFGPEAAVLVLSVVGINQLLSPILLRLALVRAGESGRRERAADTGAHAPQAAEEVTS